jgi:hypothetical protein
MYVCVITGDIYAIYNDNKAGRCNSVKRKVIPGKNGTFLPTKWLLLILPSSAPEGAIGAALVD